MENGAVLMKAKLYKGGLLGAMLALGGIAVTELLLATGFRPVSPLGWSGVGALIGTALAGLPAALAGTLTAISYSAIQVAAPHRFPEFFGNPVNIPAWAIGLGMLATVCAWLRTRFDRLRDAEGELRASEGRFRSLIAMSSDWYWEIDADLRFTRISGNGLAAFGLNEEMVIGKRSLEVPGYELISPTAEEFARTRAQRQPYRNVLGAFTLEGGERRFVSVDGDPVFDESRRFQGYRGVARDVTERRLSEDRLRALIDSIPDRVWLKDAQGRYVAINRSEEAAQGLHASQILGKHVTDLRPASVASKVVEEDREVMMSTRPQRYERLSNRGDASWIDMIKAPVRTARGEVVGLVGISRDITERKGIESALRESELRYRALFELMPDPIVVTDGKTILFVNSATLALAGVKSAAELIGQEALRFVHPDSLAAVRDRVGRLMSAPGSTVPFLELKYLDFHGRTKDVETGAVSFMEGGEVRLLLAIRDIAERKRGRERIERANAELEARVRERTAELEDLVKEMETFNYAVAHDLHTSLGVMSVNAGMLINDLGSQLAGEHRRALARVADNAQLTARLLDDLLAYARLGREAIRRTPVDMGMLVTDVWQRLVRAVPDRVLVFQAGHLPECIGDARMLAQLWSRLFSNAIKFTRMRVPARIEIGFDAASGAYFVRDNGIGFDMRHADRLFGVFERLHHEERFEGTGVGLAIAARIVRRHGGRIWADARPGTGATFWFSLATE